MQIEVKFSTKVDEDTATDVANYALNGTSLSTNQATDATAELLEDGKTVVLTAGTTGGFTTSTLQTNTGYVLTIDGVKNEAKTVTLEDVKSSSFNYSDTVAPTVAKVEAKAVTSTKQVTVTFSEPVQGVGLYKINGKVATFTPPTVPSKTITLTSADTLVGNTTYTLEVLNEKDAEGNYISSNPTTKTFSVDIDATGDGVEKVEVLGDDTIRVTFKEDMKVNTVAGTQNIKLLDKNLVDINNGGTVNVTISQVGTSTKTYDVKLSGTGVKALFDSTTKKLNATMVFTDNIQDAAGNKIEAANQPVSLTLDQVAPTIVSAKWVTPGATYDSQVRANGALVLTFSEDLASAPTLTAGTDFNAITDAGVDESTTVGSLVGSFATGSKKEVIFEPQNAAFSSATSETVRLAAGLFTDDSVGANKSAATVLTVDVKNGATDPDKQKPVVNNVASGNTKPNTIVVTFGEPVSGLNSATVLDVANYRIDGVPLTDAKYSGSYVTVSGNTATVHLPEEAIDETRNYSITVTGIKDKAGNTADMFTKTISLDDDKLPVLTAAAFNADGTISLTFSESVNSSADADFDIKLNGTVALTATTHFTVADGTGADAGKVVVTLVTKQDANNGNALYVDQNDNGQYDAGTDVYVDDITKAEITTNASSSTVDAAGNQLKDDVKVTATK